MRGTDEGDKWKAGVRGRGGVDWKHRYGAQVDGRCEYAK